MSKRLPSMNALRSFEAAARHQSFALAAAELNVSPAAVGFQVKRIEEDLGIPLFVRKHKAIELTLAGTTLMGRLTKGFDIIETAWNAMQVPIAKETLKVTAPVAAVKRWLFNEVTPKPLSENKFRVAWDVSQAYRPLDGSGVDAAIRFIETPDPELFSEPVLRTWFTPHMRPDIARTIKAPSDLLKHGLINVDYGLDARPGTTAWKPWFKVMELEPPKSYEMVCADTITAVDMAVETGHIAIGGYFAAEDHVNSGRLVAPFDIAVCPQSRLWFMCQKGRENETEMKWFRQAVQTSAMRLKTNASQLRMFDLNGVELYGNTKDVL